MFFLICSNAMQYNAPDTVYFRQAQSIQELANKNFENLRQGSEFSDATLATGAGNTIWSNNDRKKGLHADISVPTDFSGQSFFGSRNSESYFGWLAEHKFERNNEFEGSILKGTCMKNGKKQVVFDGNRRNTYQPSHLSPGGREPSVLMTFDVHRKQLVAVGLLSEYGYSRSLARFAANLETVTWKVAFEEDRKVIACWNQLWSWMGWRKCSAPRPLAFPNPAPDQVSPSQLFFSPEIHVKSAPWKWQPSKQASPFISGHSTNPIFANKSPETISERPKPIGGEIRPGPPFQNPVILHRMSGGYGFNFPAQMGKLIGSTSPSGINFQSSWNDERQQ
ncbi:DNA-binding bromodomain-containing protein [Actinidia rufa]|uniref:DNA-binding bromodomain-containing protein n=1 Tax=Actinidia rufa TaxID=165716 RepID=A0A7J0DLJ6_9ERIC|nr:DNA-binding bromodomain-containing protein [Actinidia rufa]